MALSVSGKPRPLPETSCNLRRQAVPQLASQHYNLSPVMAFVSDEVSENVAHVEGKVPPHVRFRAGNASALVTAELQQIQDAGAATLERWNEILGFHFVTIDAPRHCDAVLLAQRLDPHAPGIMNVAGKRPDAATWCSWNFGFPEFGRQVLDQKNRHPIVGFPRLKD